jgi:hypothetical protein
VFEAVELLGIVVKRPGKVLPWPKPLGQSLKLNREQKDNPDLFVD